MEVIFDISDDDFNKEYSDIIIKTVEGTLKYLGWHTNVEVSICIVLEDEIRAINLEHRNIDKVTDVLSFPLVESDRINFAFKSGEIVYLGDTIICYKKALEQAEIYGHTIKREIAFLSTHSMLHLLGYDHMTPDDEKNMFDMQEKILIELGFVR